MTTLAVGFFQDFEGSPFADPVFCREFIQAPSEGLVFENRFAIDLEFRPADPAAFQFRPSQSRSYLLFR